LPQRHPTAQDRAMPELIDLDDVLLSGQGSRS
jgi:hypothetical protein